MTIRPCLDCGAPTTRPRCPPCRRAHEQARGSRQARGYDRNYDKARRLWAGTVASGTVHCARCNELIIDNQFDLDHQPNGSLHPSHPSCNRRAGALRRLR